MISRGSDTFLWIGSSKAIDIGAFMALSQFDITVLVPALAYSSAFLISSFISSSLYMSMRLLMPVHAPLCPICTPSPFSVWVTELPPGRVSMALVLIPAIASEALV